MDNDHHDCGCDTCVPKTNKQKKNEDKTRRAKNKAQRKARRRQHK